MSHATNLTQIKSILDSISTSTLGSTFKYFETSPDTLPAGMILFGEQPPEEYYDSNYNLVSYVYIVRAIFPEEESQTAMEKWANFLDALTAEFRKKTNSTFGGTALKVQVVGGGQYVVKDDYTIPAIVFE
ncbi:hypothetical protein D6827_02450, partial [Candidatus Parcubacteria bacterium]